MKMPCARAASSTVIPGSARTAIPLMVRDTPIVAPLRPSSVHKDGVQVATVDAGAAPDAQGGIDGVHLLLLARDGVGGTHQHAQGAPVAVLGDLVGDQRPAHGGRAAALGDA